jgi:hypothetical protein
MTNKYIEEDEYDNDVFERRYIIRPFREDEVNDTMEFHTVEDKLRYFLTLYYQTWDEGYDSDKVQFILLLKKIFPNAIFSLEPGFRYVFEDGEYFFHDYYEASVCTKLMNEYTLKKFMLYGTINFGDRDREEYSDKVNRIRYNKDLWSVDWSG